MNHMRTAAEIAQTIADQGGGVWEIVRHLTNAAEELEFGWTGAKYPGISAGLIEPDEDSLILEGVEALVDDSRKTLKMTDLKKALGHE